MIMLTLTSSPDDVATAVRLLRAGELVAGDVGEVRDVVVSVPGMPVATAQPSRLDLEHHAVGRRRPRARRHARAGKLCQLPNKSAGRNHDRTKAAGGPSTRIRTAAVGLACVLSSSCKRKCRFYSAF